MYTQTLNRLPEGQTAIVREIRTQDSMRRRLYDIGLIPGTRVQCLQKSMFGDPVAFLIRGAVIALRGKDSGSILVETA